MISKEDLAEMEATSASRPLSVVMATVREPSEVSTEIANGDTHYVCLHDGCKRDAWPDEASMRRAHPTDSEMRQKQQCHVYVLRCDAPLDPLDPDGERIGYVAPVGSDGTTVARAVAVAEEAEQSVSAEEVRDLKAELVEMRAELAEMRKAKAGK